MRVMPAAVVLAEDVQGEVPRRVPPDGMDVVCVVLRVVVLDEEPRPMQPEVVRVAGFEGTGPGEVDKTEPGLANARPLRLGQLRPQIPDELLDQALGQRALRWRHVADREAHRTAEVVGATGPAHDVAKRPRADDRSIPVRCRKPADQLAGEILLRTQDAVALERPGRD